MKKEGLKIVIVDDEPIVRMDIAAILRNKGHDVVGEGSDGFEAIELCQRERPDVILLDIRMELLDGLSAARTISKECPETAIVLLTAYNQREYIEQAKGSRISSYLIKPINENTLTVNLELAVARNKELLAERENVHKAEEQLETRKIMDRAKGMLMEYRELTEQEAYDSIRQISKKNNLAMVKVAQIIIDKYSQDKKK